MIEYEKVSIKGIGSELVTLPTAKISVNYKGWSGIWKVVVSDQIPAPRLIGIDLAKYVQSVLIVTHSQGRQIEPSEESAGTLVEGPTLGEHTEMRRQLIWC